MTGFIIRRLLYMLPTLLLISFLIFVVVRIQPGDPFSGCEFTGRSRDECEKLRDEHVRGPMIGRYDLWLWGVLTGSDPRPVKLKPGLNRVIDTTAAEDDLINNDHTIDRGPNKRLDTTPAGDDEIEIRWLWPGQYEKWLWDIISRGDFGKTMLYEQQSVLWMLFGQNRLFYSLLLIIITTIFTWLVAIPIGVYSATHRYTLADHTFTFLGFVGLAIPNFFFALLLLWVLVFTGVTGEGFEICGRIAGISAEVIHLHYYNAPWDKCKILTFLWYLWPAVLVIGTSNLAMLIRYMRGNLLDILGEPYIQTARAKGLRERIVVWKHALRNAINPMISILGFWIPSMFEGTLVAVAILNWPVVERTFYQALEQQDQYTIMGALLFFGAVLMLGNLLADILLAWADPRIRYE